MSERINPYNMFVGSFLPNWLLRRTEVSGQAKLVYARLCQFAGKDGQAFPRLETIGIEIGVSRMTVHRALIELRRLKLITSKQRGQSKSNCYYFLRHFWMDEEFKGADLILQEVPTLGVLEVPNAHHIRESIKENQLRDPKPPKRGQPSAGNSKDLESDKRDSLLSVESLFYEHSHRRRGAARTGRA